MDLGFSAFYQFGIIVLLFFILKPLLFDKLLFVLQTRENNTSKLISSAETTNQKTEAMAQKYRDGVENAHQQAMEEFTKFESELSAREEEKFALLSQKLGEAFEVEKKKQEGELNARREGILANVEGLSSQLVEKITH